MPQRHVYGIRSLYKPHEDPHYLRFQQEYLKTTGKTHLLTNTTKEQMASVLPDGTILPTGKQIRGLLSTMMEQIPAYLNVPLATLPIENRMKTEPTMKNTTMDKKITRRLFFKKNKINQRQNQQNF